MFLVIDDSSVETIRVMLKNIFEVQHIIYFPLKRMARKYHWQMNMKSQVPWSVLRT